MAEHSFSLIPFPDLDIPNVKITGRISRKDNFLTLHYEVTGKIENILFPETSKRPARKDELWKATCFESFLAIPDQPKYWEFNMSPSGDWNIYHMDAYRQVGLREEPSIHRLQFSVMKETGCVSVEANVDLSSIIQEEKVIQVGITSVIQSKDGHETYWALAHPGSQADFHRRESFMIRL